MFRPPPSSTLFPYTTLFRSGIFTSEDAGATWEVPQDGPANVSVDQLDRKSTRLNSSHGYISYAVFCLKKKTPSFRRQERFMVLMWIPKSPMRCATTGALSSL